MRAREDEADDALYHRRRESEGGSATGTEKDERGREREAHADDAVDAVHREEAAAPVEHAPGEGLGEPRVRLALLERVQVPRHLELERAQPRDLLREAR